MCRRQGALTVAECGRTNGEGAAPLYDDAVVDIEEEDDDDGSDGLLKLPLVVPPPPSLGTEKLLLVLLDGREAGANEPEPRDLEVGKLALKRGNPPAGFSSLPAPAKVKCRLLGVVAGLDSAGERALRKSTYATGGVIGVLFSRGSTTSSHFIMLFGVSGKGLRSSEGYVEEAHVLSAESCGFVAVAAAVAAAAAVAVVAAAILIDTRWVDTISRDLSELNYVLCR